MLCVDGEWFAFERSDGALYLFGIWREHSNCGHQLTHLRVPDDDYPAFLATLPERFQPRGTRSHGKKRAGGSPGPG